MNIGEAAAAAGLSAKMVRYYETTGLTGPATRTEAGYRTYAPADVHLLQFIGRAREFGMPMDRVRLLVSLWQDRSRASRDVKQLALQHVEELRNRVTELAAMADTLQSLADRCHGTDRPDCPILEDLARNGPARMGDRTGNRFP